MVGLCPGHFRLNGRVGFSQKDKHELNGCALIQIKADTRDEARRIAMNIASHRYRSGKEKGRPVGGLKVGPE